MANLRIAELDFDQIKSNLKTYLKSQSEFTDYDFEGSGLSVLLDVLAYNTHYNAYLANMLANEMFLDSAVKRSSAVSIAKHLGYTPMSTKGAQAVVDITVTGTATTPVSVTLERYTAFTTTINGSNYTFLNTEPHTVQADGSSYNFTDITIKEGQLLEFNHTVVSPGPDEKYEIPNNNVDLSTLYVTVQTSSTDTTTTTYTRATDVTDVLSTSKVYYVEENPNGKYQIYFGDGILGSKLTAGNIIKIKYLVSSGSVCNVSNEITQSFACSATIGGSSSITVTTGSNSTGGGDRETLTSIKFNALRSNLSKNRAVTKSDYSSLIKAQYTSIESVSVWGGEENDPPAYGKVFISLKPYTGYIVDTAIKQDIVNNVLKERQMLTVVPEIVDPSYLYINLQINNKYNKNTTTKTATQINELVRTAVTNYFTTNLQQFEKDFYFSQLTKAVTSSDPSIVSTLVELRLQRRINPTLNITNSYLSDNKIKFNNSLHPGEIESTRFYIAPSGTTVSVRMKDVPDNTNDLIANYQGTGTIILYNTEDGTTVQTIGTVNYVTGDIIINAFTPVGYSAGQSDIRITTSVQEASLDVKSVRNQVIALDDSVYSSVSSRLPGITINSTSI